VTREDKTQRSESRKATQDRAASVSESAEADRAGQNRVRAGRGRPANVLIVDDDPEAARFMLEILARKAIVANLCSDNKAAGEFLDKNSCDLVFVSTEIDGPERGFELLGKIRANHPELPVIMMAEPTQGKSEIPNPGRRASLSDPCCLPSQARVYPRAGGGRGRLAPAQAGDRQDSKFQILNSDLLRWTAQKAVRAIRAGCCDFLVKPLDRERIEGLLDTLLPSHDVATAASAQEANRYLYQIVGKSPKLIQTINLTERIAPTSAPVLVSGESGTGKELVSYLIHHKSRRAQAAYVRVNCVALSDSLLESELFGHEKGAFTGAYTQRKGRFEMAHGGTLLLDEITETHPRFQAKLLRILEQQEFERVGGNENVRVDVRIISTTNRDLLAEVQQGRFRQDLYYRLSSIRLFIPPLRERLEDLPELVWHFVNLYARETRRRITKLDPTMMDIFASYHWPGNVRQLRNVVLTCLILGVGPTLSLADVSWLFDELQPLPQCNSPSVLNGVPCTGPEQHDTPNKQNGCGLGGIPLEQIERRAILETLRQTAGNQTKAAKVLGISDRTLREKIRRYKQGSPGSGPWRDRKAGSQQECLQPVG
jgi:DNA-binding NtrC family response regulator